MLFRFKAFAFVALCIFFAEGQAPPNIVSVAVQGSIYTPQVISIAENDAVTFEFFGDMHSVTQSSFEDPCAPLPGGFHSGFLGQGLNGSLPVQSWNLIVNVTTPIWYFCAIKSPSFHCSSGMVGAINAPQPMYTQFSLAAKMVTTTPSAMLGTPVLTGVGAFATATPTPTGLPSTPSTSPSLTSSIPTSTSTSTSTTSSPTNTSAPTNPHLGAIVGGSVGGAVALIAFLILLLWFFLRKKKTAPIPVQHDDYFRYNSVPDRRPSDAFVEVQRNGNHYRDTSATSNEDSFSTTTALTPVRRPPRLPAQSDHPSFDSSPPSGRRNLTQQTSEVDIRSLAQQVAAVLYQSPPSRQNSSQDMRGQQESELTVQNHDDIGYAESSYTTDRPPPNYRAATGPPTIPGKPHFT